MKSWFLAVAMSGICSLAVAAPTAAEHESQVLASNTIFFKSIEQRDWPAFDKLVDDSAVFTGPDGSIISDKAYMKGLFGPKHLQFGPIVVDNLTVKLQTRTAVVFGREKVNVKDLHSTQRHTMTFAFMNVFIRDGDQWRLILGQTSHSQVTEYKDQ